MSIDWDDPLERYKLIERVGPDKYNAMLKEHHRRSVVAWENDHSIRKVNTQRYGTKN